MLAAFGERNIAARQLLLRTGFVQLGAFPAMAPISKSNSAISRTCVEVEYYQLILQSAVGPTSDSAQAAPLSSPTAPFPICEASSITRPSLARPVSISVRNARIDDLPAMLAIVNHSIRESTANFDEHQYTLDDKRPWFEKHIQQCTLCEVLSRRYAALHSVNLNLNLLFVPLNICLTSHRSHPCRMLFVALL